MKAETSGGSAAGTGSDLASLLRRLSQPNSIRWLPAIAAAAYLATVGVMFARLVRSLYWDTDVAAPFVLAERLRGRGPVYIPHYGEWTSLWWMLATRHLPGHVEVWKATGYVFALAAVGLLGWATAQVGRRWAGVTAAASALIVGPLALRSLLTVSYHVSTPFTAAVLGAYIAVLGRSRARALALAVGLLAGVNAASDSLLWAAGIAPFALAAAVLATTTRRVDVAVRASIVLAAAVCGALATDRVMHSLGYHVISADIRISHAGDLGSNTLHLGRMVALLGGANYAFGGGYPREPLRLVIAILIVVALASAVVSAWKAIARRSEPALVAFACYWAAATIILGVSFVVTTNAAALGVGSMNYLLTMALAAGAGVALVAANSRKGQVAVALAVALVAAVNAAGIAHGRAGTPRGAIGAHAQSIAHLLEHRGVTHGYASYWDAQNLTLQTGMRLLVAPVTACGPASGSGLCSYRYFTIGSWFEPHPGPSFLIVDASTGFVSKPPPVVSQASASYRFGPLHVYVFDHDLAREIQTSP